MTPLIFGSAMCILMGYIIGNTFFKRLNPFLSLIGLFILFVVYEMNKTDDDKILIYVSIAIGLIGTFNTPITKTKYLLMKLRNTLSLRKLAKGYESNLEEQKVAFEKELERQKRDIEEELRRKKQQDDENLRRREEELNQREEQFKRQQGQSQNQSEQNSNSHHSQSNSSNTYSEDTRWLLNPRIYDQACAILGLSAGKTLREYKRAYKVLASKYHADKLTGLSEALKKQEEEKLKTLNVAMDTIKKKLR